MDRNDTIKAIRTALRKRSGKSWSVRAVTGTSGWIYITSPPARSADQYGRMSDAERAELGALLGLDGPVHHQGVRVADSNAYYREYIDRAEGRTPAVVGTPYWD